jgi:hypothetical protein
MDVEIWAMAFTPITEACATAVSSRPGVAQLPARSITRTACSLDAGILTLLRANYEMLEIFRKSVDNFGGRTAASLQLMYEDRAGLLDLKLFVLQARHGKPVFFRIPVYKLCYLPVFQIPDRGTGRNAFQNTFQAG